MTTATHSSSSDTPGMGGGRTAAQIRAALETDAEGKPKYFTLSLAGQTVTLNPGKTWLKVDEFKWVTRGLIEAPQSFHVEPNGTVDVNGEKIPLDDPDGLAKLEHEINKHHAAVIPKKPAAPRVTDLRASAGPHTPQFKVKLDHFGHLLVECTRGAERVETGLRGLPSLVQNGLMLPPKQFHVDPLHRGVELDGTFFEASETGARQLAGVLNAHYAPSVEDEQDSAIEIRENPAAATGFDIHFVTVVSGARFEVKGHLSQEKLELLQDPTKCDLLRPGILLRLTPPNLLFRRRRPDGGEEPIPELPDVQYRRITAPELQHLFNHPLIRRGGDSASAAALHPQAQAADLVELRVVRNPQNKALLWLECRTTAGGAPEGKAFTHHNVAALQAAGVFRPHLDVSLSLDHQALGILNKQTGQEDKLTLDTHSSDTLLAEAGRLLTAALKPPSPREPAPPTAPPGRPPEGVAPVGQGPLAGNPPPLPPGGLEPHVPKPVPPPPPARGSSGAPAVPSSPVPVGPLPAPAPAAQARPGEVSIEPPPRAAMVPASAGAMPAAPPSRADEPESGVDPAILAWFVEGDPLAVNRAVFERLALRLAVPVQDILLTLPRAFEDRRFQVISFSHPDVESILDLRSEAFYGFYLSHVSAQRVLLVYACRGRHIEWGPDRCLLQPAVSAEPSEFKHSALLGLAQDPEGNFVFVVTPGYRDWAKGLDKTYGDVCARFATPKEIARDPGQFVMIWPDVGTVGEGTRAR